jgi:hypothetical protein
VSTTARKPNPLGKPTAIDYVVMIGMPAAFLAIAFWGILWAFGPPPPENPVSRLKQGVVKPGMTQSQVVDAVGREPQSVEPSPDGGFAYVYHRGTSEPFVEEDAAVHFNSAGFVIRVTFERSAVPIPEN